MFLLSWLSERFFLEAGSVKYFFSGSWLNERFFLKAGSVKAFFGKLAQWKIFWGSWPNERSLKSGGSSTCYCCSLPGFLLMTISTFFQALLTSSWTPASRWWGTCCRKSSSRCISGTPYQKNHMKKQTRPPVPQASLVAAVRQGRQNHRERQVQRAPWDRNLIYIITYRVVYTEYSYTIDIDFTDFHITRYLLHKAVLFACVYILVNPLIWHCILSTFKHEHPSSNFLSFRISKVE